MVTVTEDTNNNNSTDNVSVDKILEHGGNIVTVIAKVAGSIYGVGLAAGMTASFVIKATNH